MVRRAFICCALPQLDRRSAAERPGLRGGPSSPSDGLKLVRPEMGAKLPEGNHDRQGRTDGAALPVMEDLEHFTLLTLEIEGLTSVLGMVIHHDALADRDLITWLHGLGGT